MKKLQFVMVFFGLTSLCLYAFVVFGSLRPEFTFDPDSSVFVVMASSTPRIISASVQQASAATATTTNQTQQNFQYIEVADSCDASYSGPCVLARSGPGTTSPVVARLRTGIVLKTDGEVQDNNGGEWYKIIFDEELLFPERVISHWYVSADSVQVFTDPGIIELPPGQTASSTKYIVVDRVKQTLTAYDGDKVFMETVISTGLYDTPTPRGTFMIYKKTPSRYMQGPTPGSYQYYDLPGVPWDLYFTYDGAAIHGAYWHDSFGEPWSHGCVNLPLDASRKLYVWADVGTKVVVKD